MRRILLSCAAALVLAAPVSAQYNYVYGGSGGVAQTLIINGGAFTLTSTDQGWYNFGSHDTYNDNYVVGELGEDNWFRDWFTFDLTGIGTITSAALQLETYDVTGPLTVNFYDFTGDQYALMNGTGGMAAFTDLGTGQLYASQGYDADDSYGYKTIALNSAAIADLNSAQGLWTVGGRVTIDDSTPSSVTPEPTSMVLLGSGLAGVLARRRRRKADAQSA